MTRLRAGLLLAACSLLLAASHGTVLDLETTVLDLVTTVEHLDGDTVTYSVEDAPEEVTVQLSADVLFDFDSAELSPGAQDYLLEVSALIAEQATGPVDVAGHTDGIGDDAYNQDLSERRAEAVREFLATTGGLRDTQFRTQGYGKTQPVASETLEDGSDNPDGRQRNRRVTVTFVKGG